MKTKFMNALPGVPNIESPFFKKIFTEENSDPELLRVATELNIRGYAVIDFPDVDFGSIAEQIKSDLMGLYNWDNWRAFGHENRTSLRIQDAWKSNLAVKRLAVNKKVIDLLSTLYGKKAWPFQTLNFPVGTQQHFHTDSVHFSSVPERFMCGVWVALEDITMDSGPLVYYPGSHRWPIYTNEFLGICVGNEETRPDQGLYEPLWRELVDSHGVQPEYFTAKKGQALIWAANLLHGGCAQKDKNLTRWSQVTHYYFDGCAYYTPMTSDPFIGTIDFKSMTNIVTGKRVTNMYAGQYIQQEFIDGAKYKDKNKIEGFDSVAYLKANPDVAASGMAAEFHYIKYGRKEGRKLKP